MYTHHQTRSFLQLGKCSGKDSISVAVDVASKLMISKGMTLKFTLDDLRDNISLNKCGSRGQSRKFHQLDEDFEWNGRTHALKVPVVYLEVFTDDIQENLKKGCKLKSICVFVYRFVHTLIIF